MKIFCRLVKLLVYRRVNLLVFRRVKLLVLSSNIYYKVYNFLKKLYPFFNSHYVIFSANCIRTIYEKMAALFEIEIELE